MAFSLDDYVDVAERVRLFYERWPDGRLATRSVDYREWPQGGVLAIAEAYRTADDPHPGVGTAWEPVPGKTQFTRDSEVQNAETAAWGRAIVACGIGTKHVASRQEVEARTAPAKNPRSAVEVSVTASESLQPSHTGSDQPGGDAPTNRDVADGAQAGMMTPAQRGMLFAAAQVGGRSPQVGGKILRDACERVALTRSTSEVPRYLVDAVLAEINRVVGATPR